MINPLDREELRRRYLAAKPFPHLIFENFLVPTVAAELSASYPSFATAAKWGLAFNALNEQKKIQVTDSAKFAEPVRRFNDAIASRAFLDDLAYITGIPDLLADDQLAGGGMHLTGPGGRLDVHVDFNYLEERKLHRRLNLLLYLNPTWEDSWGGHIELWDKDVKTCAVRRKPVMNLCLIFETSDISFHGVVPVTAPADVERRSFAAYYYTRTAPPGWKGVAHTTIFKARPDEKLRGYLLMPARRLKSGLVQSLRATKRRIKSVLLGPR